MSVSAMNVEIVNITEGVTVEEVDSDSVQTNVNVNGKLGLANSLNEQEDTYVVYTVDGFRLAVPNANLKTYEPPSPEDGGFDLFWPPNTDDFFDFAAEVHNEIVAKSWCLLQVSKTDSSREAALGRAIRMKLVCPRPEFQKDFLGSEGKGKVSELDPLSLFSIEDLQDQELPWDSYGKYNKDISDLLEVMGPMTWDSMGFRSFGRTDGMVWLPFESSKESRSLEPEPLTSEDIESGIVENHLNFVKRRKLCFMYFIDNAGDTLTLHPRGDLGLEPVKLPATKGKMLVFRCDLFRFEFNPQGEHLTLLSWVLEDAPQLQMLETTAPRDIMEDLRGLVKGPRLPNGQRPHIMSMAQLTGGEIHDGFEAMAVYSAGVDGHQHVPHSRFDVDLYFTKDGEADHVQGRNSYHVHGSMISPCEVALFDPLFFGLTLREGKIMNPNQKKTLETGYDCLFRAGHTKATLRNNPISFVLGECNNDWWQTNMMRAWMDGEMQAYPETDWLQAKDQSVCASRLHYIYGMTGSVVVLDTACSAGLVAFNTAIRMLKDHGDDKPGPSTNLHSKACLAGGCNIMTDSITYIGTTSQHMNSVKGRCFTFDVSAEGFAKGEGVSLYYTVLSDDEKDIDMHEACCVGSKVNQDGRSASMTAPNGPAQQMCIKASMAEAGLLPHDITASECHGTGTALGDPIEVGSLRGVQETDERENGLCSTSAKSNLGHLEGNAGSTGILKCILMSKYGMAHPNVHLRSLNAHLDISGWPAYFQVDMIRFQENSALIGVNSFGASGTNSHAEIFGLVRIGPDALAATIDSQKLSYVTLTCPVTMGPIDHITGEAVPRTSKLDENGERVRYSANSIRDELAPYDISSHVYSGGYRYRQDVDAEHEENEDVGCNVSICGSWTGFTKMEDMELDDDDMSFGTTIVLGDTRCESFYLCLNGDPKMRIYPAVNRASQLIYVKGPDDQGEGKRWMIDGRDAQTPAGVMYQIRFQWKASRLLVEWEEVAPKIMPLTKYQHIYCVKGTWTTNSFQAMKQIEDGIWESIVKIGVRGEEKFQLGRDYDDQQCIYPSVANTENNPTAYACGPDDLGKGRSWVLRGVPGDSVKIRLETEEAKVVVKIIRQAGEKVYESLPERHNYSVVASWNDYTTKDLMTRDPENPSIWRLQGVMGQNVSEDLGTFYELFQIQVDGDPNAVIYPPFPLASVGECIVEGPDDQGQENFFVLKSPNAGISFEIVLDLKALDRRNIISCKWAQPRVYDFRSGNLQLSLEGNMEAIGNGNAKDIEDDE